METFTIIPSHKMQKLSRVIAGKFALMKIRKNHKLNRNNNWKSIRYKVAGRG